MRQRPGGAGVRSVGVRVSRFAIVLLIPFTLVDQTFGQCDEPFYAWHGPGGSLLGASVSGAGDINGDGYDDVVVAAPQDDVTGRDNGTVYVYSGVDGSILRAWHGERPDYLLAGSVDGAGDVNGDGFDDVIAGTDEPDVNGSHSGGAYVYSGGTGELLHVWYGDHPGDRFGWSVSGAGDVNGDGFDDVVVGSPFSDPNGNSSGAVYVYSGRTGDILHTWVGDTDEALFGHSVSGAGDVNADGFGDVIVSAPWDQIVTVYDGATGAMLYKWYGAGDVVSGAGDVNRDGFADLVVGGSRIEVHVFSGATGESLYTFHGDRKEYYGDAVSGAGDFDGDGFDDVVVGALVADWNGDRSGSAYLYSGANGGLMHVLHGENPVDFFGNAVSSAGDMNGDGLAEILIGARGSDANGSGSGSAYVFRSSCSPLTLRGPTPGIAN